MLLFTLATLIPIPLLLAGSVFGGLWALAALAYMTLFVFLMDEFVGLAAREADSDAEFPAADRLSVLLGGAHFVLLVVALAALTGLTGVGWATRIALFLAFGMFFGQVSNSNAHELIHRSDKRLFQLGMWVYISLLFGHHTSAHRLVHHRYVATPDDPNSAVMGDSFYVFAPHAWWGSFLAGAEMESALRKNAGSARVGRRDPHPYVIYVGGAVAFAFVFLVLFGFGGLLAYLALAGYAQMQLLLSDYVQHYGLERARLPGGRAEAVGPAHSWNSGHWYSAALMLNAPRHSDHHAHPARPYPELTLPAPDVAPRLPHSLPVMGAIALYPPAWFRMMDKRAARWRARAAERAPETLEPAPEESVEAAPEAVVESKPERRSADALKEAVLAASTAASPAPELPDPALAEPEEPEESVQVARPAEAANETVSPAAPVVAAPLETAAPPQQDVPAPAPTLAPDAPAAEPTEPDVEEAQPPRAVQSDAEIAAAVARTLSDYKNGVRQEAREEAAQGSSGRGWGLRLKR